MARASVAENLQPLLKTQADQKEQQPDDSQPAQAHEIHNTSFRQSSGSYQPPELPPTADAALESQNDQSFSPMHLSLHTSTNVAVLQPSSVKNSPSADSELKYKPQLGRGDSYLLLSIVLSAACVVCLTWWSLPCTLAGLFFSIKAQKAAFHDKYTDSERLSMSALYLNITGIIVSVVSWFIIIVVLSVLL